MSSIINNPVVLATLIIVCVVVVFVIGYFVYNAVRKGGPTFGPRYQVAPNLDLDFTGVTDTNILTDALLGHGDLISIELEKVVDDNNGETDTQLCENSRIHIAHGLLPLGKTLVVSETPSEYHLCDFGDGKSLVLSAKLLSSNSMATMVVKSEFKGFALGSKLTLEQINKIPKGIHIRWTTKNGLGTKLSISGKTANDLVAVSADVTKEFKRPSVTEHTPDYNETTSFKIFKA